jgi:hypothetical protein
LKNITYKDDLMLNTLLNSLAQVNTDPMISVTGHLDVVVPPSIVDEESSASEASNYT